MLTSLFAVFTLMAIGLATARSGEPASSVCIAGAGLTAAVVVLSAKRRAPVATVVAASVAAAFVAGFATAVITGNPDRPAGLSFASDLLHLFAACSAASLLVAVPSGFVACVFRYGYRTRRAASTAASPALKPWVALIGLMYTVVALKAGQLPYWMPATEGSSGERLARRFLRDLADKQEALHEHRHAYAAALHELGIPDSAILITFGGGHFDGVAGIDQADSVAWSAHVSTLLGNWTCRASFARARMDEPGEETRSTCTRSRAWFATYGPPLATIRFLPGPSPYEVGEVIPVEAFVASGSNQMQHVAGELALTSTDTSVAHLEPRETMDLATHAALLVATRPGVTWLAVAFHNGATVVRDSVRVAVMATAPPPVPDPWLRLPTDLGNAWLDTTRVERRNDSTFVVWWRSRTQESYMSGAGRYNTEITHSLLRCRPLGEHTLSFATAINDGSAATVFSALADPHPALTEPTLHAAFLREVCVQLTRVR